jgi:hypothetical protein
MTINLLKNIVIYTGLGLLAFIIIIASILILGWPSWAAIIGSGA